MRKEWQERSALLGVKIRASVRRSGPGGPAGDGEREGMRGVTPAWLVMHLHVLEYEDLSTVKYRTPVSECNGHA